MGMISLGRSAASTRSPRGQGGMWARTQRTAPGAPSYVRVSLLPVGGDPHSRHVLSAVQRG